MKSGALLGVLAFIIVLAVVGLNSTFVVTQIQQALVLRFGEPVPGRGLVQEAGLHFKLPFVENVVYLDNRLLRVETPNLEVLASDRQRLEVDAFAIYRINNPLRFYQTVGTIARADNQIASVLNTELRRVLGRADQQEIVNTKRAQLMIQIRDLVNTEGLGLGVNVVDVRIRRADLPKQISEQVFERMRTERQREAADFRGQGAQIKETIKAKADKDITVLLADAQQQADQLKGEGESEANEIFGKAAKQDPDFFAFWRSMSAFDVSLKPGNTRLVLNPSWEFLRYFNENPSKAAAADPQSPSPAAAPAAASPGSPAAPPAPPAPAPPPPKAPAPAPAAAPSPGH